MRALRKALDLTQEVLADRVGLRQAQISGLESARNNITIDNLHRLAVALGVRPRANCSTTECFNRMAKARIRRVLACGGLWEAKALSQAALAADAGIYQELLSLIENGAANPELDTLARSPTRSACTRAIYSRNDEAANAKEDKETTAAVTNMTAAMDDAKCRAFGYQPSSPLYFRCRDRLDAERNAMGFTDDVAQNPK